MKRRKFIIISGSCALAAGVCYLAVDSYARKSKEAIARPASLMDFMDSRAIREIGDTYRKHFPGEDDDESLIKLLTSGESAGGIAGFGIAEAVSSDFKDGKTMTINGWILSVTEARQCALFSLLT